MLAGDAPRQLDWAEDCTALPNPSTHATTGGHTDTRISTSSRPSVRHRLRCVGCMERSDEVSGLRIEHEADAQGREAGRLVDVKVLDRLP
jgi:hypothetical protein